MIDLFTAKPVMTVPLSLIHVMGGNWAIQKVDITPTRAAKVHAYYLAHLKEIKAYQADYREQNREAIRKRQREWIRQKRADAKKAKAAA